MLDINIIEYLRSENNFLGCFAYDELPPFPKEFPKTMIINTDKKSGRGIHWLGLVLTKKRSYYFDSFGLPVLNRPILKYLRNYYKQVTYSDMCIQHVLSKKCGEFCIAFVKNVKCKKSYSKFVNMFDFVNLMNNDTIVMQKINKCNCDICV